ncbi:hypothetical protein TELCIR_17965 [Teladorsagia circumcincta]|uniref:Uncharacterized protein n=1 Tax=Teladorsagia circumcincta TaxID=45464 RepID=A0A2G9TRH2_TELCI|nr:hypothetical protein TELCIR_17965 [Teladorsagia circumcincta]
MLAPVLRLAQMPAWITVAHYGNAEESFLCERPKFCGCGLQHSSTEDFTRKIKGRQSHSAISENDGPKTSQTEYNEGMGDRLNWYGSLKDHAISVLHVIEARLSEVLRAGERLGISPEEVLQDLRYRNQLRK